MQDVRVGPGLSDVSGTGMAGVAWRALSSSVWEWGSSRPAFGATVTGEVRGPSVSEGVFSVVWACILQSIVCKGVYSAAQECMRGPQGPQQCVEYVCAVHDHLCSCSYAMCSCCQPQKGRRLLCVLGMEGHLPGGQGATGGRPRSLDHSGISYRVGECQRLARLKHTHTYLCPLGPGFLFLWQLLAQDRVCLRSLAGLVFPICKMVWGREEMIGGSLSLGSQPACLGVGVTGSNLRIALRCLRCPQRKRTSPC